MKANTGKEARGQMGARLLLCLAVLLAACGPAGDAGAGGVEDGPVPVSPAGSPPASPTTAGTPAPGGEIRGVLGGDPQLEGGCAWVDADDGTRYEVVYPDGYAVEFTPLRLLSPDGTVVAEEGDRVVLPGTVAEDMVSVCQVGPLWRADEVRTGSRSPG